VAPGGATLMFFSGVWDFLSTSANWRGNSGIPQRVLEHLEYSGIALGIAVLIGLPLGLLIGHSGRGAFIISIANALRALPSLGLLVFFLVVFSSTFKGKTDLPYVVPTEIVLIVLAIPGILSNTYAGVQNVDVNARDAARGMGMRGLQVLRRVEFPCALPLIISGIRNATLQVIATATVAAQIGLGGLGRYIVDGLAEHKYDTEMAAGGVLVAALVIVIDLLWALVARFAVSRGLSGRYPRSSRRIPSGTRSATDSRTGSFAGALTGQPGDPAALPVT
jgi:osmoprotectant transport system permease protein